MTDRRAYGILRQVSDAARAAAPDAALLAWFAAERDEAAFAELVRRHGPAVLGVCRRVARHPQDAEDAFQAVFLILATKAGRLTRPELLGNWLYGVAYRIARRARRSAARRRAREGQVVTMPEPTVSPPEVSDDLSAILDDALTGLPERFREAILLCDLYQLPRAEAASRLGIPEGTLSSRLAVGRKKLAARLARRGVTAPAAGLAAVLGGSATAGVPPGLALRAVAASVAWAGGGVVPAAIRQLATDGGPAMIRAIGWTAAACAAVGLTFGVVAALPGPVPDDKGRPAQPAPEAKADDEGEKPVAAARLRLVKTIELSGRASTPIWSPNGDLLAVKRGREIWMIDTRKQVIRAALDTKATETALGFLADKPVFVTLLVGRGRINAEHQLRFWDIPGTGEGQLAQPARTVNVNPEDRPIAVRSNGRTALAVQFERRLLPKERDVPPQLFASPPHYEITATRFRLFDVTTGVVGPDIARVTGEAHYVGLESIGVSKVALTPTGDRLFVTSQSDKSAKVECFALPDGKKVWERTFAPVGPSATYSPHSLQLSGDGSLLALTYTRIIEDGPATQPELRNPFGTPAGREGSPAATPREGSPQQERVVLLNPINGTDGPKLDNLGFGSRPGRATPASVYASGLSHDGRLMAVIEEDRGTVALQIWNTHTGKLVKSWDDSAHVAFAPDRPVLVILENIPARTREGGESILGFWDLSALVK
jgi:RNA polymerase sigma factor (sigma-70 family)